MPSASKGLFRLGLIGAGAATRIIHIEGALASPDVVVTAIVDPVLSRAQSLANEYGIAPTVCSEVAPILGLVDGVMIVTPNHTHCAIAVECLKAGVPCLVEKPMAISAPEAEMMCEAAAAGRAMLAVGYTTQFRDEVLLLRELLDTRYFGSVRRFHYQEGSLAGWSPLSGFTIDRNASGGGLLVGTGTHFLDRMLYWFGYPRSCTLMDNSKGGPESHCLARFQYDDFQGTLLLSKLAAIKPGLVIDTERGTVIFPMGRSPLFFRPRGKGEVVSVLCPKSPRRFALEKTDSQLEIENFVHACRGQEAPMVDGRQGLLSVRLISALYEHRSPMPERWLTQKTAATE